MRLDRRYGTYLTRLMSRITIKCDFQPETALTIEIADRLRRLTLDGRLRAVWFHVPNEGKRTRLQRLLLRMMGLIPGVTDFVFLGPAGGVIELKAGDGKLSPMQIDFRTWCEVTGVPWACCRSWESVEAVLLSWGTLTA
jgi:hypothetical protein